MVRMRWVLACSIAIGCGDDTASVGDGSGTGSGDGSATAGPGPDSTATPTTDGGSSSTAADTSGSGTTTGGVIDDPFGDAIEIPLGLAFTPLALALGDVDGDGALDLIVTGTGAASTVQGATLRGDGAGGFMAAVDAQITACSAFPVVGELDGDGRADLFFGTCADEAVFFRGNADGSFAAIDVLGPWAAPPVRSSAFVDHDGDGDSDLALLTVADAMAELHLASHAGATPPWPVTDHPLVVADSPGFDPDGLVAFAADADARTDLLALDLDHSLVAITSDGDGFATPTAIGLDVQPWAVAPVDLDGDGIDEIAVASLTDSAYQLVGRTGDGGFASSPPVPSEPVQPLDMAVGDHGAWLAAIDDDAATLAVLRPAGDSIALAGTRELPVAALRVLAGDLDGDGDDDLVVATFANGSVTVLLADG